MVSRRQEGNPVLLHIRVVRWQFADIVPDYLMGSNSCALYLSLRYHLLHPEYLHFRIRELQPNTYRLKVVICHVDVDDVIKPLGEVTKACTMNECTLVCAWSIEEVARYLELLKSYENKPADLIQERIEHDFMSRLTGVLTNVRSVNKTDVHTLGSTFGTLAKMFAVSHDQMSSCPGFGPTKVKRLHEAFHTPFKQPLRKQSASAPLQSVTSPTRKQAGGESGAPAMLALMPPPSDT